MRTRAAIILCFTLCACSEPGVSTITDGHTNIVTFFTYDDEDRSALPRRKDGTQEATLSQLVSWGGRVGDIARTKRLSPPEAARLYAAVAVAQRDTLLLGGGQRAVNATGASSVCALFPDTCPAMAAIVQNDQYDLSIDALVSKKMRERLERERQQVVIPVRPPRQEGSWPQNDPLSPEAGSWLRWGTESDVTLPAPLPAGSAEDQEELRLTSDTARSVTEWQKQRILYWNAGLVTETTAGVWMDIGDSLLLKHPRSILQTAQIRATLAAAAADAMTAAWKAKFTYWTAMPGQRDVEPTIPSVYFLPLYPGYPSEHAMVAAAAGTVLAAAFPEELDSIVQMVEEASNSRVWNGASTYREKDISLAAGEMIGKAVLASPPFAMPFTASSSASILFREPLPLP